MNRSARGIARAKGRIEQRAQTGGKDGTLIHRQTVIGKNSRSLNA